MVRRTREQAQDTRRQIIDAASGVFHRRGVSGATLQMVAEAAGLTRGAIYWHFKNKADLFRAVHETLLHPVAREIDTIIDSHQFTDPLDAIEAALVAFFATLDRDKTVRMALETIARCREYINEFVDVHREIDEAMQLSLAKIEAAYRRAGAAGTLRAGLHAELLALDTWSFACGLIHRLLTDDADGALRRRAGQAISNHLALRRSSQRPSGAGLHLLEDN
jgi:TetR/AcrR family acrAB operon transcriptional repressor